MYRNLRISVVLPAFNEAQLLPKTVSGIPHFVDQIFIIDDASTDETARIGRTLQTEKATLVQHEENQGVGRAIASGYAAALECNSDVVVVMGADNQMNPDEIPALLDPIVDNLADYTKGNRLGHPQHKTRMPIIRRFGTLILSRLTATATGLDVLNDSQCGFTAISAQALRSIPYQDLFPRYGYPNDLISMLVVERLRIRDVVVTPIYSTEKSHLKIHRVFLPILGILIRSFLRRIQSKRTMTKRRTQRNTIGSSSRSS